MSTVTIERVRKRFVVDGLAATERRKPPAREYRRALTGEAETHPVALSCSKPTEGEAGWSMRLLAKRLVELRIVETMSDDGTTGPQKNAFEPWQRRQWCLPRGQQRFPYECERRRTANLFLDCEPLRGSRRCAIVPAARDRQLAAQRVEILAT